MMNRRISRFVWCLVFRESDNAFLKALFRGRKLWLILDRQQEVHFKPALTGKWNNESTSIMINDYERKNIAEQKVRIPYGVIDMPTK